MSTVADPQNTVEDPQHTVSALCPHGAAAEPDEAASAMTAAIHVRLPRRLADNMQARAAMEGQTAAEWVRRRIAHGLAQPVPRVRRRGRRLPAPGDDLKRLIDGQEALAAVGIALRQFFSNYHATAASPERFATNIAGALVKIEDLSGQLVRQIEKART